MDVGTKPLVLRRYPAKILLFGEYTVIDGSPALSIPFAHYSAQWKTTKEGCSTVPKEYIEYLIQNCQEYLDTASLSKTVNKTLFFSSNIPQGMGLGSSGALVAALYDRYALDVENMATQRDHLAEMESFFHGKSSGFDPLVSLLGRTLCLYDTGQIRIIGAGNSHIHQKDLFLVDSGQRRTRALVPEYLNMRKSSPLQFDKMYALNASVIQKYIVGDEAWKNDFIELSHIQFKWMKPMIVPRIEEIWEKGLLSESYYMKICGSGGGGYYLLMDTGKTNDLGVPNLLPIHFDNP